MASTIASTITIIITIAYAIGIVLTFIHLSMQAFSKYRVKRHKKTHWLLTKDGRKTLISTHRVARVALKSFCGYPKFLSDCREPMFHELVKFPKIYEELVWIGILDQGIFGFLIYALALIYGPAPSLRRMDRRTKAKLLLITGTLVTGS